MLVVDTCVLIDIADDDPEFGTLSADCLARHLSGGLTISPVTYVELAPVFDGSRRVLEEFLDGLGVERGAAFDAASRDIAFSAWARHITARRGSRATRRPVADALIGALAAVHDGIVTRSGDDFASFYPALRIIDPTARAE
jgi:predicted nucleic acid-binding protein